MTFRITTVLGIFDINEIMRMAKVAVCSVVRTRSAGDMGREVHVERNDGDYFRLSLFVSLTWFLSFLNHRPRVTASALWMDRSDGVTSIM